MMNVLIFGFGFLGKPLAEKLTERGHKVRAIKRYLTSDDICLPIELDCLDMAQGQYLEQWAEFEVWVWLLPPSSIENYADIAKRWVNTAVRFGVKHVIFASTTSVYGYGHRECNEYSSLDPQAASACKVVDAEQSILNGGVTHTDVLRLGGLYSAERHPLYTLLKRDTNSGGLQPVNMLHRDRAVSVLIYAINHPNGMRIRNIVESAHPTKKEFYASEARKLGLPTPVFDDGDVDQGKIVHTVFNDFANV